MDCDMMTDTYRTYFVHPEYNTCMMHYNIGDNTKFSCDDYDSHCAGLCARVAFMRDTGEVYPEGHDNVGEPVLELVDNYPMCLECESGYWIG